MLDDRQHVLAVAIMRQVVENVEEFGAVMPESVAAAIVFLRENHPPASAYMKALREPTDSEKVDATTELLVPLELALTSKNYTVQVMPHGIELINVETGDTERVLRLTEVQTDA